MNIIYVIIAENGYDGFERPYNEQFYLTEAEAQVDADKLNRQQHSDSYFVEELTLKTK